MSAITKGQAIIAVAIAVVILSLCGIIVTVVLTGGVKSIAEVTLLIGLVGTLVSAFLAVLKLGQVSDQLNGHLALHEQSATEQAQQQQAAILSPMIEAAVKRTLAGQAGIMEQMRPMIDQAVKDTVRQLGGGQTEPKTPPPTLPPTPPPAA